ncbi:MAG: helix-turn-helix domain-containing protein [Candidatus Woesearchaeota archaeon]|jgi:sugar-specific transcriptional regulator TrmB
MQQELMNYGLSDKEAAVYLVCLKTGQATANRLSELSNLARSTTYDILEQLKNKGLVTTCIIDNKTQFNANTPDVLLTSLNEKKHNIEKILPSLKNIYKKIEDKPTAEVFQGKIAVIKLFDEILDNAKTLKVIGSQGNALEKIGYHPEKFRLKRLENKIKIKQILEVSKDAKQIKNEKYTEVRFLKSLKNSKEAIFIFDDYVYHLILQYEISAIKIKSIDHANTMNIMFDDLWNSSKK